MTIPHEPWLVALSVAIAIQGSFVGLSLARGIDSAEGFRRRLAIAGSAITLATGVWSMHFVAMLAANFPSAVDYLVLPTLISFLICVIVVGIGVYAAHAPGTAGVSDRHGRLGDGPRRQPHALCRHVGGASGRADVLRAFLCRRFNRGRRSRPAPLLCGRSTAGRPARGCSSARSRSAWRFPACTIPRWRGCASTRCATTFRASSAPNWRCRATRLRCSRRSLRSACPAPFCSRSCRMRARPKAPRRLPQRPNRPRRSPRQSAPPDLEPTAVPAESACTAPVAAGTRRIDPGREGRARARHRRRATSTPIRANAHYTYVHDGEKEYFCNLSISALEARLDPKAFLRVHRSYIVSVDRIARVKRSGEAGVAELGLPVRCSIPIARAHYRQVKLRIGAVAG